MSAAPSPAPRLEARRKCVGAFPFVRWSAEKAHKVSRYVAPNAHTIGHCHMRDLFERECCGRRCEKLRATL